MVYETPAETSSTGFRNCSGIKGISNVGPTRRTSQKSCVGTLGSLGEGENGLAVWCPISGGMGKETHSNLEPADQHGRLQREGKDGRTHRISPLASVIVDPSYTWFALACWMVRRRYPLASSAVEVGVSRPDPGKGLAGDRGAEDIVVRGTR